MRYTMFDTHFLPQHKRFRCDAIAGALMDHMPSDNETRRVVGRVLRGIGFFDETEQPVGPSIPSVPRRPRSARTRASTGQSWRSFGPEEPRFLHGSALRIIKAWDPSLHGIPTAPVVPGVPIDIWGRRWIVQTSQIFPEMGLGVFACEDIVLPLGCPPEEFPELFPFSGPMYDDSHWRTLSRQCHTFGRYALRVKHNNPHVVFVDGYPPRAGGVAGYINSSKGLSRRLGRPISANAQFIEHIAGHRLCSPTIQHVPMVVATRSISAGEEILVHYHWRPSPTYAQEARSR